MVQAVWHVAAETSVVIRIPLRDCEMMYELELIERDLERDNELELSRIDEVLDLYHSLCRSKNGSASAYVECGDAFRAVDMIEHALRSYGDAIGRDAGCLSAYLGRGELMFELAVLGTSEEEVLGFGTSAVNDFRMAMMLSLGSSEVVWRLGTSLLVVGDLSGARGLAKNVLSRSKAINEFSRRDFMCLLAFAKLFMGEVEEAGEVFEEMLHLGGGGDVVFGKLVVCLMSGDADGAAIQLGLLNVEDRGLWNAGNQLREAGCRDYLDVARSIVGIQQGRGVLI